MVGLLLIVPVTIAVAVVASILNRDFVKRRAEDEFEEELRKLEAKIDRLGKRL